jgi:hypothetical protein
MIFADKTPYIEQLEKNQTKYRYMFLRPRRFGKSAFLNMLCEYYDIHRADVFKDLFGPLYIGKNPTLERNQHLVLKFDLSSISVSGSMNQTKASFNEKINGVLNEFVNKYNKELGYPKVGDLIVTNSASQSLVNILVSYCSLVRCVNTYPVLLTYRCTRRLWLANVAIVFL